jgi:hypothetical protein
MQGLWIRENKSSLQSKMSLKRTLLRRVFTEGILLVDRDPDRRTDLIEYVSMKYRECAGLLAEASLL